MNKTALKKEEKVLRMKNVARNEKKKVPAYGKRSSKSCRKIVDRLSFQTRKKISTIEVFSLVLPMGQFLLSHRKYLELLSWLSLQAKLLLLKAACRRGCVNTIENDR